ncbi:MAG: adenylosuccinate synthase [Polyangiaceae bacterium]|nr:adenylosuccinate synthase [Polyangiaceae bacterium]
MAAVVVVGAQWGDEGKGKIVDCLAESADVVARYAGGPNAGHTLVVGGERVIVRLVPSGILRAGKLCVLGQGMVIDPKLLVDEIDSLQAKGYDLQGRLFVSRRAHLILSHHILADGLRETEAAEGAIGTTRRGIGPAYEDKAGRRGLTAWYLGHLDQAEKIVEATLAAWQPFFASHCVQVPTARQVIDGLRPLADRMVPLLADTSQLLDSQLRRGKSILLEGAQGTLLDLDHGTYPFVTSSSAVAGGACTGGGVGPRAISRVLGAAKAYVTRVGGGPFPTELHDDAGAHLRRVGVEFGSVTGRPRRAGWLDLPALRYAVRVNGLDGLALTKLDVLTGLDKLRVCVAYDTTEGRFTDLPVDLFTTPGALRPVYEELPGWSESLADARSMSDLPARAREYVKFIEQACETPCDMISVGPTREALIKRRQLFDT